MPTLKKHNDIRENSRRIPFKLSVVTCIYLKRSSITIVLQRLVLQGKFYTQMTSQGNVKHLLNSIGCIRINNFSQWLSNLHQNFYFVFLYISPRFKRLAYLLFVQINYLTIYFFNDLLKHSHRNLELLNLTKINIFIIIIFKNTVRKNFQKYSTQE